MKVRPIGKVRVNEDARPNITIRAVILACPLLMLRVLTQAGLQCESMRM